MEYFQKIDLLKTEKRNNREQRIMQLEEISDFEQREWFMNQDDYGCLPLPDKSKRWEIIPNHKNGSFYELKGWSENFCDLMEKHPVYLNENDAFAGHWIYFMSAMRAPNIWNPDYPYTEIEKDLEKYSSVSGIGGDAHFAPDFSIGLELGWKGLLDKINYFRGEKDQSKNLFYDCHIKVIKSIQSWIKRHIEEAGKLVENEKNPAVAAHLKEIIDCNKAIINDPPSTFREALQWIIWFHLASRTYNRDGAGGQLDELLRPYYENDMKNGILDDSKVVYYLACFLINDPMYWQVAGPDAETGKDMTSHISYLILDAASKLDCSLNITVRVHDKLDEIFFKKAVECLLKYKNAWPRFSGDKALVEGFMNNGYKKELARKRIAVGCNWMSLPGMEYTLNDLVKVNFAKVFEIAFHELVSDKNTPLNIDELWSGIKKHLRKAVHTVSDGIRHHLKYQQYNEPELILNLLSHGPIEKGVDISAGGAEYYNLAIDGAGLSTIADSMAALEQRIEIEKSVNWNQIAELLSSNWDGIEGERLRLLMQNSERYGQGNSLGDKWALKITELFTQLVVDESSLDNRYKFIPGLFSWASTLPMGRAVGATPNGRKDQEPISHGANPHPGFSEDGASTALALAISKVQPGYGNTAPMQLELDPSFASFEQVENICSLIKTHFDLGGTLLNINIIDKNILEDAHKNPEKYPDLVVRVTGFTAYFSTLTPEFRQLVVDRVLTS